MALCLLALPALSQSRLNISSGQLTKTTQVIPTRTVEYASDGVIVTYTIPTADEIPASDGSNSIIWAIQGFTPLNYTQLHQHNILIQLIQQQKGYQLLLPLKNQ